MSMVSAKAFALWLKKRFSDFEGIVLERKDINILTGRQNFTIDFVNDIHYELMRFGMAFVTDTNREKFYLIKIKEQKWEDILVNKIDKSLNLNIFAMDKLKNQ